MLLCAVPILWAAVTDYRKRIIPDWTWVAVLLIGGASAFFFRSTENITSAFSANAGAPRLYLQKIFAEVIFSLVLNMPYVPLLERILGFLLPGASLLFCAVRYDGVGGGDIKMTAAMGFCFGLYGLAAILIFAFLPAFVYVKVTGQKSIPLAVFLCIGYFLYIGLSLCL